MYDQDRSIMSLPLDYKNWIVEKNLEYHTRTLIVTYLPYMHGEHPSVAGNIELHIEGSRGSNLHIGKLFEL